MSAFERRLDELATALAIRWDRCSPWLRWVPAVLAVALVGGWVWLASAPPPAPIETRLPLASSTPPPVEVVVHAAGAVQRPGVYRLPPTARVTDLIEQAGLAPGADPHALNLADVLVDGDRIHVPLIGESIEPAVDDPVEDGPLDINRADEPELDGLPGVGPAIARAIVEYRTENGPFGLVDELIDVPGIGPAKLAGLRDLVVARP